MTVLVGQRETARPWSSSEISLKTYVAKECAGAVVGVGGAKRAFEGVANAGEIEKVADIGIILYSRAGISFGRQRGVGDLLEIVCCC